MQHTWGEGNGASRAYTVVRNKPEQGNRSIIRQCLWRKNETQTRSQSLASWGMICKPKKNGGLGILDFKKQNEGLLLKHLHKFFNKEDIP